VFLATSVQNNGQYLPVLDRNSNCCNVANCLMFIPCFEISVQNKAIDVYYMISP